MLQYARCPKNLTRTLVPFCRDLTICVTWNIYSCFKEAVMMTRSTAVELDRRREDWVAPYQDGTEESREGKNWGENPWTCWKVWAKLYICSVQGQDGVEACTCTECQSLGETIKFPLCICYNWHETARFMPFSSSINFQARTNICSAV